MYINNSAIHRPLPTSAPKNSSLSNRGGFHVLNLKKTECGKRHPCYATLIRGNSVANTLETRFLLTMKGLLKKTDSRRQSPAFRNTLACLIFLSSVHSAPHSIASSSETKQTVAETFPEDFDARFSNQLAMAGNALEYGKTKNAAKLATGLTPKTPEARLVLARLAAQQENYDEAKEHYCAMYTTTFELESIRILELVKVLEKLKKNEEIVTTIEAWLKKNKKRKLSDKITAPLHTARARALRKLGQNKKALKAYKKAMRSTHRKSRDEQLKVEYGTLLLESGSRYRGQMVLTPLSFEASRSFIMEDARTALDKAGLAPKWTDAQRIERSDTLRSLRAWDLAVDALQPVLESKNRGMVRDATFKKARLLMRQRRECEKSIAMVEEITPKKGVYRLKADLLNASCLSRIGKASEAIEIYKRIAKDAEKQRVLAAKMFYNAVRLEYFSSQYNDAAITAKLLLKKYKSFLSSKQKQELLFIAGISMLSSGYTRLATDYFFEATKGTPKSNTLDRSKYIYWRAVAALKDSPEKAEELFHYICNVDPTLWYSQLAVGRLEEAGLEAGPCVLSPLSEAKPPHPPQKTLEELSPTAAFLRRAGFYREAGEHLGLAERHGEARASLLDFMQHYENLQSPQFTIMRAWRNLPWPPDEDFLYRARAAYPKPFVDIADQVEEKHNLPSLLILSIARKESLFHSRTISYAGAMGLMQFMPQTYEINRIRAGLPPLEDGEFPDPIESITCAGYEFEDLMTRFNNQLPLAIMAYNGGSEAVSTWADRSGDAPTDIFVEKIAYQQTRNYVRRVYQNLARYRLLDGQPAPKIPPRIEKIQRQ